MYDTANLLNITYRHMPQVFGQHGDMFTLGNKTINFQAIAVSK